eukprot:s873_g23.t1
MKIVKLDSIPEQVWAGFPIYGPTPGPPEAWVDELADKTEVARLVKMSVLIPANDFSGDATGKLTAKFVRDWRLKDYTSPTGEIWKRWMRRSRCVAREFASARRLDTLSPTTGGLRSNLLPLKYLWQKQMSKVSGDKSHNVVLVCLDIKDAFLQEQPCIARNAESTIIIIHVDDIMYVGDEVYWEEFLKGMSDSFAVSHSQLNGVGSSITSLRHKITEVEDGLMLRPGTSVSKVLKAFEDAFGAVLSQQIPCGPDIQMEDASQKLGPKDATAFRSIVGLCLYVGCERPGLAFTIKELASVMANPTLTFLQRLRKMGDVGVKWQSPLPGQGKCCSEDQYFSVLESYSDADWIANKSHGGALHAARAFSTTPLSMAAAEAKRLFPCHPVSQSSTVL